MEIGTNLDVLIMDNDNNGNGIAKVNNLVIFIPKVLKDEEVTIKIIENKKKYSIGELIKIKKESPLRKKVLCSYYDKCGGCNFLHISYEEELKRKEEYIKKLFPNITIKNIVKNEEYNYRNKVTLHVKNKKLGFYKKESNTLIEIDNCLLLNDEINRYIGLLKSYDLSNVSEIMIRVSTFNNIMIKISGTLIDKDLINLIKESNLESLYFDDKLIYNKEYMVNEINNKKYTIYPDSFFQVNTLGMVNLYNIVKDYSKGDTLLDLYCGTGTIGIYLSDNFKKVLGIEINKSSVKNANLNKKINKIENIEFILSDSDKIKDKYDMVVVDPPRAGLTKKVINNLKQINSEIIVYVSCNPSTLKKDIDLLDDKYSLEEINIVNMFPKTNHVELVALLIRR